jgi:hypothetical protein
MARLLLDMDTGWIEEFCDEPLQSGDFFQVKYSSSV